MLRRPARALRDAWQRLRFAVWAARLRSKLRRCDARLELDAPHGAAFANPPRVKCAWMGAGERVLRLRIGARVDFGRNTSIDVWGWGTNVLEIGDDVRCEDGVRIQLRGGAIRIGDNCELRDVSLLRSGGELTLGREVAVSHSAYLHCEERIEIGDLTGIAERVTVADSGHAVDGSDVNWRRQPLTTAPVSIGRNVTVFANAVVLHGAHLGDNSAVAANAVVLAGDYPASWLIGGIPAKPLKALPRAPAPPPGATPASR